MSATICTILAKHANDKRKTLRNSTSFPLLTQKSETE